MTLKDSKIDSALIINGKILKRTIPDPNKIKDGINNIILAIILSPIKFWTNTDCDWEICHISNNAIKREPTSK